MISDWERKVISDWERTVGSFDWTRIAVNSAWEKQFQFQAWISSPKVFLPGY
jgi:hypothetical protein